MNNGNLKSQLKTLLEHHEGRNQAITRREIRRLLQLELSDDRGLRLLIAELRHEGTPILMNTQKPAGYYIPESLAELKEGIHDLRQYIIRECWVLRDIKVKGNQYLYGEKQTALL